MANNSQKQIGAFIKTLRERKGITQGDFAKMLSTSQSAVARMEKGEQNFSTDLLNKISTVLGQSIVSINNTTDFEVNGGKKLHGSIKTNFSKNGSVGLLCASLLNKGKTTLHGIARIEEVYRVIEILESIGVKVKWTAQNSLIITPPTKFNLKNINVESAIKTRSIVMLMGPLAHHMNSFSIPHAQGCNLGKRTISAHTYALADLGIKIKTTNNSYEISSTKIHGAEIVMYEAGDTAFENVEGLVTPFRAPYTTHVFHQYTLKVKNNRRDEFKKYLDEQNIPNMIYYPVPLYKQEAFKTSSNGLEFLANTELLCQEVISLPIHTEMDEKQLSFISGRVKAFFE